jgi:hypothetical protein
VIDVNSSSIGLAMPPLFPFKKKVYYTFPSKSQVACVYYATSRVGRRSEEV